MSKQRREATERPRKLQLRARAERMEQTRQRIVEAAVELHQTVGPLDTTISAIAERAGVERLTVYRHFPDEPSLFAACTAHYFVAHPPPDLNAWAAVDDPVPRLVRGLTDLYDYWARTRDMTATILRDGEAAPDRVGAGLREFHSAAAAVLTKGWGRRGSARRLVDAAILHASAFPTWRSLVEEGGLSHEEGVALMMRLVTAAAEGRRLFRPARSPDV